MNSLLCPGQGSQLVGMGHEFYNKFEIVKNIFSQADKKLKFSLSKIILEGPEDQLKLTKITQPAILTVSYSIFKVLKDEFNFNLGNFNYFAGHSLGEYSALVCANSLNFDDAIYLLHERGKLMQEAVPIGKGSMIAVLGSEIDTINKIIQSLNFKKGICQIANDNAEGQVIVSGDKESVGLFQSELKKNKIKAIPLKVSAPFHCALMEPAAEKMKKKIDQTVFSKPDYKIISNVTAEPEEDPENIKKLLVEQISSLVNWRNSMIFMSKNGVKNFIEIGPGKTLSGMVKRTIKNVNTFSINSIADIEDINARFKK